MGVGLVLEKEKMILQGVGLALEEMWNDTADRHKLNYCHHWPCVRTVRKVSKALIYYFNKYKPWKESN